MNVKVCPNCGSDAVYITDCRVDEARDVFFRSRKCTECGYKLKTYEIPEEDFEKFMHFIDGKTDDIVKELAERTEQAWKRVFKEA